MVAPDDMDAAGPAYVNTSRLWEGGGIYALRGHASIQGSTDIPTLFNLLAGYLPMPDTRHGRVQAGRPAARPGDRGVHDRAGAPPAPGFGVPHAGRAVAAVSGARRSRLIAAAAGLALLAGSASQRFGTFEAGVASIKDPKYVVVPQRERLEAADGERHRPA
jgi:anaerobic selenocysteine-containing dehydrogenase